MKEIQVTTDKILSERKRERVCPSDGKRRETKLRVGPLNSGVFRSQSDCVLCPRNAGGGIRGMWGDGEGRRGGE